MDDHHKRRRRQVIADETLLLELLDSTDIGFLGLSRGDKPYVVPVNFTRQGKCLYIHSAPGGRKIDYLKANPNVCLTVLASHRYLAGEGNYSFRSVIVTGQAVLVEDREEKIAAYQSLCRKIDPLVMPQVTDDCIDRSAIVRIDIKTMSGKKGSLDN